MGDSSATVQSKSTTAGATNEAQGIITSPDEQNFVGTEKERQKFDEMMRGNPPEQQNEAGKQVVEMTNNPQQQELDLFDEPK